MSVREIEKNKKYQIEIVVGYNGNKKIREYETFYGGKKDAILRENQLKLQIKEGVYIKKNDLTLQDLSREWLETKKRETTLKTYADYECYVKLINKKIGHTKLTNLNVKVLESFYNYLKNEYLSNKGKRMSNTTIQHYYVAINNMLKKAIIWDYIKSNPNEKIKKPKRNKKEMLCYSSEEVENLIKVLQAEPLKYKAIIYLALDSGARRGEITGLTWNDIDFKNCCITINKITQYLNNKTGIYEKETKTKSSNRKIYISKTTLKVLKLYKLEQNKKKLLLGSKWKNSMRVFTTEDGADMHPDTPSKILTKVIKKYNLRYINFHGLRHTSISLMIYKGVQHQIISRRAGHSSVQVTDTIYSHFFEDEFKEVSNVMNEVLQLKEK